MPGADSIKNKKGNHRFCVERVYKIMKEKKNAGTGRKNRLGRKS
jgi:hypothetical protein